MRVTKIEAQIKTQGRYSIYIDGVFSFGLSELALVNSGLRVGQELTTAQLDELKQEAKDDKIYDRTLTLIARRPRSKWEVEDYLRRKEVDPATTEKVLKRLEERRFVNDKDFATRWVESRRLTKAISRKKLMLELRQKRIDTKIIQDVLSHDDTDEIDVLKLEIEKKRRQSRYQDDTKLLQYLARQGYAYQDIKSALSENAG